MYQLLDSSFSIT